MSSTVTLSRDVPASGTIGGKRGERGERPTRRLPRRDNRRQQLLDRAAQLFSERGFAGTTMRDVAGAVGMLPGSVYYHFASKEELLVAVHTEGIRRIGAAAQEAIGAMDAVGARADPWTRLEALCGAHLRAILERGYYPRVVTRELPDVSAPLRLRLARLRDDYEALFRQLVDDLPLPGDTDRRYLRLALLGALNWCRNWYSSGGDSPEEIARHFVDLLRHRLQGGAKA